MTSLGTSHRTLREAVADEIRAMILRGEIAPGERLVEDRLAEQLGVSRNPVREAIRLLESTGLVEVRPRRGAQVVEVDVDDLDELLDMRTVIEGHAAFLAASRRTDDDVSVLRDVIERGRTATEAGDAVAAATCHREFHVEVERISANRYLAATAEPLRNRTELIFSLILDTRREGTWAEHDAIVEAIGQRNGRGARAAVREHLAAVQKVLRDLNG